TIEPGDQRRHSSHQAGRVGPQQEVAPGGHSREAVPKPGGIVAVILHGHFGLAVQFAPDLQSVGGLRSEHAVPTREREACPHSERTVSALSRGLVFQGLTKNGPPADRWPKVLDTGEAGGGADSPLRSRGSTRRSRGRGQTPLAARGKDALRSPPPGCLDIGLTRQKLFGPLTPEAAHFPLVAGAPLPGGGILPLPLTPVSLL